MVAMTLALLADGLTRGLSWLGPKYTNGSLGRPVNVGSLQVGLQCRTAGAQAGAAASSTLPVTDSS